MEKENHVNVETVSMKSVEPKICEKAISSPSMPTVAHPSHPLKEQISAPSYLHSLKENQAPPFQIPERRIGPKLLIGTVMNEQEVVDMIAASDDDPEHGLNKYLGTFLVQKKVIVNTNLPEKKFLISFLAETIDYAAQRDFSTFKLACLITVYLSTHMYFKWYYWMSPNSVWVYFKEIMIRHTIEDSPDGQQVFEPEECYDILSHFHTMYMNNLPLVHILTFGVYKLKYVWPFKAK